MSRRDDLRRIEAALDEALLVLRDYTAGAIDVALKDGGDPVTEADTAVNDALLRCLPQAGEGWLSEETVDDPSRLERERVWVVDPLDGTKEFVQGIPEWCVSIGLVENGKPVAGGVCNPSTGDRYLGSVETGVTLGGGPVEISHRDSLDGALVLASRSEVKRGEWERFEGGPFEVRPTGSVAFKLAEVAVGRADVTWTLVPKNEWDLAGGVALVLASGGEVSTLDRRMPTFNCPSTLFDGLVATTNLCRSKAWADYRDRLLEPWTGKAGGAP